MKLLSRVQLLATPWTAAHQAPPPMGFSRQEYWSGVPSLSLLRKASFTEMENALPPFATGLAALPISSPIQCQPPRPDVLLTQQPSPNQAHGSQLPQRPQGNLSTTHPRVTHSRQAHLHGGATDTQTGALCFGGRRCRT